MNTTKVVALAGALALLAGSNLAYAGPGPAGGGPSTGPAGGGPTSGPAGGGPSSGPAGGAQPAGHHKVQHKTETHRPT